MVWCDNCLLLFPLRLGAIALATFIMLYSIGGGIVLFLYGQFLYFWPASGPFEASIYGGISMAVAAFALLTILAFANSHYALLSVSMFAYALLLVLLAIRLGLMVFRLDQYEDHVLWECANGRQVWNATIAAMTPVPPPADGVRLMPAAFCKFSWHSLYYAFTFSLVIDLILNAYLFFMTWRFKARLLVYSPVNMILGGKYGANAV